MLARSWYSEGHATSGWRRGGGTLVFDELGDIGGTIQGKPLRPRSAGKLGEPGGGTCGMQTACHTEGEVCLDGIPCCQGQGVCLGGSCQKSNPGPCNQGGGTCNYGGQCCTGLCSAHKCTTDDGWCTGAYAICTAGRDCCSGFCVQQECQPGTGTCIDQVEACDFDAQCCTGSCQTNVCL